MLRGRRIAVIGTGTMGRSIVSGLVASGKVRRSDVAATARTKASAGAAQAELGIRCGIDNAAAVAGADVVLLCVKPRDAGKTAEGLRDALRPGRRTLVVSIAAGVTTGLLEEALGGRVPVVRAMPNTPCLIGKGMTVLSKGAKATDRDVALAREIFLPLGRVLELEEKHMDTVTGLSASGPAFIYVIIEALADGGVMRGLPRQVATELVAQMTLGAAEMILSTGRHPAALKDDVTTPAGCTIAGILALEDGRIRSVLARGVETAAKVAGELAR
jgi:pyrroline-5-carboxylate reductase